MSASVTTPKRCMTHGVGVEDCSQGVQTDPPQSYAGEQSGELTLFCFPEFFTYPLGFLSDDNCPAGMGDAKDRL